MVRLINALTTLLVLWLFVGCAREKINIEKTLVEKVVVEFTEERLAHYLKAGEPKTNASILEKVLSRHSLRLNEFSPAFRRFQPEICARIIGS